MIAKKILLIDPPFQKFMNFSKGGIPLGLLSLAGSLKKEGHEVKVFDADYNPLGESYPFIAKIDHYKNYLKGLKNSSHEIWKDISSKIEKFSPEIVGISLISTKLKSGLRIAEISKNLGVKKVFAGGPHATINPESIIKDKNIDAIMVGESEKEFNKLFEHKIVYSERIKDLNAIPPPSRSSLMDIENYHPTDLGFLMTSRGCVGQCNFCCSEILWGRNVRKRSIENVFFEIDEINEKYGTTKFYIVDDTFTLSKKRVLEFGKNMKNRGFDWSCLTRMDKIDEELIENMKDSGCTIIKTGIESGNERVLKSMNKGTDLTTIKKSAKILNSLKMPWLAYFIIGSPEETTKEMYDTIRFIEEISPTYISASIYTPYPGNGFSKTYGFSEDFALEEANHHSLEKIAGRISKEELRKFMEFADSYNQFKNSKKLFSK